MNSVASNIQQFLTNADHCERMPLEVRNDDLRQMYADLAKQWRELVRHICKMDRKLAA